MLPPIDYELPFFLILAISYKLHLLRRQTGPVHVWYEVIKLMAEVLTNALILSSLTG